MYIPPVRDFLPYHIDGFVFLHAPLDRSCRSLMLRDVFNPFLTPRRYSVWYSWHVKRCSKEPRSDKKHSNHFNILNYRNSPQVFIFPKIHFPFFSVDGCLSSLCPRDEPACCNEKQTITVQTVSEFKKLLKMKITFVIYVYICDVVHRECIFNANVLR